MNAERRLSKNPGDDVVFGMQYPYWFRVCPLGQTFTGVVVGISVMGGDGMLR